ncbi:MAG: tRNA 4-thiouridine(8) synthase ThiI [Desulfobacula sp.]|nr:tRNA 4-thiouridine(8) synthase ThiI [Desulfobacula sp.]
MSDQTKKKIKGLGLCSGGLDSILSALLLQSQGIETTWICFETPFFSAKSAIKASRQTGIELITLDITKEYMKMMRNPKAGFGKNMNPCMDCHALMFSMAGKILKKKGFDFLFSGEVMGQRPKSQNKNSLRYVEKNSGFDTLILRPLSAKLLAPTIVEQNGKVDREKLLNISGRSRKIQMQMAKDFGIKEYPSPAGGCLLTDKIFSRRLKDLMETCKSIEKNTLHLLKFGRHFRLDPKTKVIVGRSQQDNKNLIQYLNKDKDILLKHASLPGPDVILTGDTSKLNIETAAMILAGYTKSKPGEKADIKVIKQQNETIIYVTTIKSSEFRHLMI